MMDVFTYSDYRQYLKDYYERNKALKPAFSYRYLAQKAGINSSSYFKLVIEGKRNLTKKTILKMATALKLEEKEADYFENLVFLNQARTPAEKNIYFEKLLNLQRRRNIPVIEKDQMEFFREWHHSVIRELATMKDFGKGPEGPDFARLGRMVTPPIPAAKAEASVKLLLELGFLRKEAGRYVQVDPVVGTGPGADDERIVQYQAKMMQLAIESFTRSRADERMVSSATLGVSRSAFETVVRKFRDFRAHLMDVVSRDRDSDRVYQLTISLIPMSEKKAKA